MKTQNIILSLVLLSTVLLFSSCKENHPQPPIDYDLLAEDVTLGDQVYSDIFGAVSNESGNVQNGNGSGKAQDDCGFVTTGGYVNDWPTMLSIDYGTGCTDDHGITRKGKLTIAYDGPLFTAGSSHTVTTDNYYVNGHTVDGTLAIANNGINNSNNYEFSVSVQQGRIMKPDGNVVTLESIRTFEWIDGDYLHGLLGWCDNAWRISGSSEGTTSDGRDYNIGITTPLTKKSCCLWVVEGSVSVMVDGDQTAALDYGDGECDKFADYSHNGLTDRIILH